MREPTKCTFMRLSYMYFTVSTYMFRSFVWPSSGCSIVWMPGVQQKSHKMYNRILQGSVHYKISTFILLTYCILLIRNILLPYYLYKTYYFYTTYVKYTTFIIDRTLENCIIHFTWLLLYSLYSCYGTPWRWSHQWPKHVGENNKMHI
jgi:hypothetical protein